MADPNKKHYFSSIKDKKELGNILKDLVKSSATIMIWTRNQDETPEKYVIIQYREENNTLVFSTLKKSFFNQKLVTSKFIDRSVLVKSVLGRFTFFSTGILNYDQEGNLYSIEIKHDFFKCQQRQDYRLAASTLVEIKVEIESRFYDAADVSASGSSFYVPYTDDNVRFFKKDNILQKITATINQTNFFIPKARVIKLFSAEDEETEEKKLKVCIQFVDLPLKTDEKLSYLIHTHVRKIDVGGNDYNDNN